MGLTVWWTSLNSRSIRQHGKLKNQQLFPLDVVRLVDPHVRFCNIEDDVRILVGHVERRYRHEVTDERPLKRNG